LSTWGWNSDWSSNGLGGSFIGGGRRKKTWAPGAGKRKRKLRKGDGGGGKHVGRRKRSKKKTGGGHQKKNREVCKLSGVLQGESTAVGGEKEVETKRISLKRLHQNSKKEGKGKWPWAREGFIIEEKSMRKTKGEPVRESSPVKETKGVLGFQGENHGGKDTASVT